MSARERCDVIGAPIDVLDWEQALARIGQWATDRESRSVCICNVHSVVTARNDARFRAAIESSDMATADGAPVAWLMRRMGYAGQPRIDGPDLMWRYCAQAAARGEAMFLLGSTVETLARLKERLQSTFPGLQIVGTHSPPFREATPEEDRSLVNAIVASGARTVWVGLGCPKQELWMAAHRGRIPAVMIGVGAAFDFHAGTRARAPHWMRRRGLEWLHRLASEPRRLGRRYLTGNSIFVMAALMQCWRASGGRLQRRES